MDQQTASQLFEQLDQLRKQLVNAAENKSFALALMADEQNPTFLAGYHERHIHSLRKQEDIEQRIQAVEWKLYKALTTR